MRVGDYLFFIVAGYLSGGILFGYWIPKLLRHMDIREVSKDGNAGVANVFMHAGVILGIVTLVLELAKGFLPVFLAARVLDVDRTMFALVIAAPVAGHAFPVFAGIHKGGKAIAVSFGVLIGMLPNWMPLALLIFFYLFFSLVCVVRPHRLRSIVTFAGMAIADLLFIKEKTIVSGCLIMAGIVSFKHLKKSELDKLETPSVHLLMNGRREKENGAEE